MSAGAGVRAAAARTVAAVAAGRSLDDALPQAQQAFDARDRALLSELAYGTVRWWLRIAHHLDALLDKRADEAVRALLATGIYQLGWMRIPPHAAVAATVDAAADIGRGRARGLVNAVLRSFIRRREELQTAAAADPVARTAHPGWLLDALHADWPQDRERMVEANNAPAPMCLRVNRRRVTRDAYLQRLTAAGIDASPVRHAADGIVLTTACSVDTLPGFADGHVSVQDAAGQLAADLLAPTAGARVLDACAAPGGKACHLLERHPGLDELVAVDVDPARLERVHGNLERLGLAATVIAGDASHPDGWWDGRRFERILLDAPCTATGVIRRHPDIRLLRRPGDAEAMAARQRGLLAALWPLLADGGMLLYTTCSVLRAENDRVIGDPGLDETDVRILAPEASWGRSTQYGRQILPGDDGMDGFYYACLLKADGPEKA